jgi:hypothetical protein
MIKQQYLVLEYQTCQQKISSGVEHLIRIELYVFLGISALYAWFYATLNMDKPPAESIQLVLYLPTLLAILGFCRLLMQLRYIRTIAEYLRLIEEKLASANVEEGEWLHVGWETWNNANGPHKLNNLYRLFLWFGLIVGTSMIAVCGIGV